MKRPRKITILSRRVGSVRRKWRDERKEGRENERTREREKERKKERSNKVLGDATELRKNPSIHPKITPELSPTTDVGAVTMATAARHLNSESVVVVVEREETRGKQRQGSEHAAATRHVYM